MYIDSNTHVLVCDCASDNEQVISATGKKCKNPLPFSDGIEYPEGLVFRPSDRTLVVSCEQDELIVLKLE